MSDDEWSWCRAIAQRMDALHRELGTFVPLRSGLDSVQEARRAFAGEHIVTSLLGIPWEPILYQKGNDGGFDGTFRGQRLQIKTPRGGDSRFATLPDKPLLWDIGILVTPWGPQRFIVRGWITRSAFEHESQIIKPYDYLPALRVVPYSAMRIWDTLHDLPRS